MTPVGYRSAGALRIGSNARAASTAAGSGAPKVTRPTTPAPATLRSSRAPSRAAAVTDPRVRPSGGPAGSGSAVRYTLPPEPVRYGRIEPYRVSKLRRGIGR